MEKYIFIAAVILGLIEIALYQIKDKKKRFVAMAYVGVFVMAMTLVGTIIAEMDGATIYMAVLMIGYIISLSIIWRKIPESEKIERIDKNKVSINFHILQYYKEENWLNKMAEEQKALTNVTMTFFGNTYDFSPCESGKYCFHVEYQRDENTSECISFMQGDGAEFICKTPTGSFIRSTKKLYFRKEREVGTFDGFYDKRELNRLIKKCLKFGLIGAIAIALIGLLLIVAFPNEEPTAGIIFLILSVPYLLFGYWAYRTKIKLRDIPSYKDLT